MSTMMKALSLTGITALLFAGAAPAQEVCDPCAADGTTPQSVIVIDQIQTGDLWSSMEVHVDHSASDASANATTVGNSAAGLVATGDLDYDAIQTMHGSVDAAARLDGETVTGTALTTATAYGNASTAGASMGSSLAQSHQTMTGDVVASSLIELRRSNDVSATTTAMANVATTSGAYGNNNAFQTQSSEGSVEAMTSAMVGESTGQSTYVTTAGGNTINSNGYTATAIQGAVQTTAAGEIIAGRANIEMEVAGDVLVATTAAGNSYLLNNEFGYASLGREGSELYQGNESEVLAGSFVDLSEVSGDAAVSAYGVGNSAALSNLGSDTALHAIQSNFADVSAEARFTAADMTGGVAQLSSVAIGNTATASLCITCGQATVSGSTTQFNAANITATGSMTVGTAGSIFGSATAIGNAATYQSSGH